MKIGELVKAHLKGIFHYCETVDHAELGRLMERTFSKTTFNINFPVCAEVDAIPPELSKRYWSMIYLVRGKSVRVSSQWFEGSRSAFIQYLRSRQISLREDLGAAEAASAIVAFTDTRRVTSRSSASNSRHRGSAIGNAQNLMIRNILSSLGSESFTDKDWLATKEYFAHQCAYCGVGDELLIEHAVPINRRSLGEHRLGNLVPSCKKCNQAKAGRDYREFLGNDTLRIDKIETYMDSRNYVPLGDNSQVRMILDMAYGEVPLISQRYITLINALLPKTDTSASGNPYALDRFGSETGEFDPDEPAGR
jgi:5-methylcytosine-specific restriction endonuclease McrA